MAPVEWHWGILSKLVSCSVSHVEYDAPTLMHSVQSRLTRSLDPQHSVVACSTHILCCRGGTLQTRPQMGVGETLIPDVVAPKVHQNYRSYVSSADLPSDSLHANLA